MLLKINSLLSLMTITLFKKTAGSLPMLSKPQKALSKGVSELIFSPCSMGRFLLLYLSSKLSCLKATGSRRKREHAPVLFLFLLPQLLSWMDLERP
jgi:hypothetical protein